MDNYGVDKPDLRFENRICDVSSSFRSVSLPFLQEFSGKLFLDLWIFRMESVTLIFRFFLFKNGCSSLDFISVADKDPDPHGILVPDPH
jgi:hypothetical protein